MNNSNVNCSRCELPIESRSDLRVANRFKKLMPFHKKCFNKYIEDRRESGNALFDTLPLNSVMATIMAFIFFCLIIVFTFFVEVNPIAYFLFFIYPLYRVLSWILFEIRIPK